MIMSFLFEEGTFLLLREHVLSYSICLSKTDSSSSLFFFLENVIFTFMFCVSLFIRGRQKKELDAFQKVISSLFLFSNQHCYIINRVQKECAGIRFKIERPIE